MTSRAFTPWLSRTVRRRSSQPTVPGATTGSIAETRILDHSSAQLQQLLGDCRASSADNDTRAVLRAAHPLISERVRPVYALDDAQPVSRTLERGRGSCSQRLAVLEAVARAAGVPTRCRGLLVDGRFWYPRFPGLRAVVPDKVVLAWPEFDVAGRWVDSSTVLGTGRDAADGSVTVGFTNLGGETLFEAVGRGAVRWDGPAREDGAAPGPTQPGGTPCSLSGWVLRDLGRYASRDELFAVHGQTLCWPERVAAWPLLSRWSAGAAAS